MTFETHVPSLPTWDCVLLYSAEIKGPREGVPATHKEASILTVTVKDTRAETTPDGSPDRLGLQEIPNPTVVGAFSCAE